MSHQGRVLVIDDEKVACNSCGRVLEREGYDVSLTTSAREGAEKAARENFDAVIVDMRMPVIGGMDVLRIIKRSRPETRVIVMTGYSSVGTAVEAMQLGAADYLPKPFTPKELTDSVGRLLQRVETRPEPEPARAAVLPPRLPFPEAGTEESPGEARILLAGSDTEEMASLRECLSAEPWQVKTMEGHEEIIEAIRAGQADVLIIGLDVLGMKAYDLIPEVKRLGSNIPIIVACADPSPHLARKIREFGIFFYLMEPFDADEVRAAARDAVRKAVMLRRQSAAARPGSTLVRCIRTAASDGRRVGFVAIGESLEDNSHLYREIICGLKRRSMPAQAELADRGITAGELPRYLEQDDTVVIVAPFEANARPGELATYSAEDFETLATEEQRTKLRELAYPEVLHWLKARGISPKVKLVCLNGEHLPPEQAREAASAIIAQGLA